MLAPRLPALVRTFLTGVVVLSTSTYAAPTQASASDTLRHRVVAGTVLRPRQPATALPVRGYRLTGRFGDRSSLWSTVHTGLDFAAPLGTTIRSVAAGVVVSTGYDGSYGDKTVIRLGDGTELWYCHQLSVEVRRGEHVRAGQAIGRIGTTGNVTGPHLHLEVHPGGGDPVDPLSWLRVHGLRP